MVKITFLAIATALISSPAVARLSGEDQGRGLTGTLQCPPGSNVGNAFVDYVLYTTSAQTSCSDAEITEFQLYALSIFDGCINDDDTIPFELDSQTSQTGCSRRLETEDISSWMAEKQADIQRRLQLSVIIPIFGTGAGCNFCSDDGLDQRKGRRGLSASSDDVTHVFQNLLQITNAAETCVTHSVRAKYDSMNGHCMQGKNPEIHVFMTASDTPSSCGSDGSFEMHCCAPKADLLDICSPTVFGEGNWWCHETQSRCENNCAGHWVDALDPQFDCLSNWAECTGGQSCCEPYNCIYLNEWYAQCLEREPTAQELATADYVAAVASGTCGARWAAGNCHAQYTGNPALPDCCSTTTCVELNEWYSQCL